MTTAFTILTIAGSLHAMPEEIVEVIRDTPELTAALGHFKVGSMTLEQLIDAVSAHI